MATPHQTATDLAPQPPHVTGALLRSEHPLVLPGDACLCCGSREPGGSTRSDWVTYVNPLIWLFILISGLLAVIAYMVTRKKINVQYYLCPACTDKRRIRSATTSIVSAVSVVGLIFAIVGGGNLFIAPFAVALIGSTFVRLGFGGSPLRAVAHRDERFLLKGASPRFLRTVAASPHRLEDEHRSASLPRLPR